MRLFGGCLLVATLALAQDDTVSKLPAPAAANPELTALFDSAARRFEDATAVEGRFVQSYKNRILGRTVQERGTLLMSPPGNVRWEYKEPDEKLFVASGKMAWFYVPADAIAYRMRIGSERARLLPSRFLLGRARLTDEFTVTELDSPDGTRRFSLQPRAIAEEFIELELELSGPELAVSELKVIDSLGNETLFAFEGLAEVDAVPDSAFKFVPPLDVEVVLADQ